MFVEESSCLGYRERKLLEVESLDVLNRTGAAGPSCCTKMELSYLQMYVHKAATWLTAKPI